MIRNCKCVPIIALIGIFSVATSCQKDIAEEQTASEHPPLSLHLLNEIEPLAGREPLTYEELSEMAINSIDSKGIFHWSEMNDYIIWSAAVATDSIISLGYQPDGFMGLDESIHLIDPNSGSWKVVREAILDFLISEYNRRYTYRTWVSEDILAFGEKPLPYLNLRVWDYEILATLRNFSVTRYCEPMGFGIEESNNVDRSDSGCGGNVPAPNVPTSDFYMAPQGAMVSWNYIPMKIHKA